jgi:hypothetical protein
VLIGAEAREPGAEHRAPLAFLAFKGRARLIERQLLERASRLAREVDDRELNRGLVFLDVRRLRGAFARTPERREPPRDSVYARLERSLINRSVNSDDGDARELRIAGRLRIKDAISVKSRKQAAG